MKKILLILMVVIVLLVSLKTKEKDVVLIPSDSIRLRIISNSDADIDINTKMGLKNHIESLLLNLVKDCKNTNEVTNAINKNFDLINSEIYNFLGNNNFKLDFGQNYFPKKIYKGLIYQEGMYNSLVITLGSGEGSNWWCVLFPPLCLLEENVNTSDVEYQLFISRIINSYK